MKVDEAIEILAAFVDGFEGAPEEVTDAVETLRKTRQGTPTPHVVPREGPGSEGWKNFDLPN